MGSRSTRHSFCVPTTSSCSASRTVLETPEREEIDRCTWPVERPQVTLLDLNENSVSLAAQRLARYAPRTVRANVLDPLPLGDAPFESAAANYPLHCLPGQIDSKAATLAANVRPYLEPGGVLFGTILGRGVTHTKVGRRLSRASSALQSHAHTPLRRFHASERSRAFGQ